MYDLVIQNGQVVLEDRVEEIDLAIQEGKFVAFGHDLIGKETIQAKGLVVIPGKVDSHVHINAIGGGIRDDWEGVVTATAAAAKGGVTTLLQMPCNQLPATVDGPSFQAILDDAKGKLKVDVGQTGGVEPQNLKGGIGEQDQMGVINYKAFLGTTGDKELGNDLYSCDDYSLYEGMRQVAQTGKVLILHCENATITDALGRAAHQQGKRKLSDFIKTRPAFTEVEAIERACLFARETGCRIHIVHVSSKEGVEAVERAKERGIDVSCETCNHYLYFKDSQVDQLGNQVKCTPPVRDQANQEALWKKVLSGAIDFIVSDHSPAPARLKETDDAFRAWGGIASLQNDVDIFFDEAVQKRGMSLLQFVDLNSKRSAERFGLNKKGSIAIGKDADLAFIQPHTPYCLKAKDLEYRQPISPYIGKEIGCRIVRTFLRGKEIYSLEKGVSADFKGEFILHPSHKMTN